jgi:hypothetical protein
MSTRKPRTPKEIEYFEHLMPQNLRTIPDFVESWRMWIEGRTEQKKPVTERAANMQWKLMLHLRDPLHALQRSIAGQWEGIHADPKHEAELAKRAEEQRQARAGDDRRSERYREQRMMEGKRQEAVIAPETRALIERTLAAIASVDAKPEPQGRYTPSGRYTTEPLPVREVAPLPPEEVARLEEAQRKARERIAQAKARERIAQSSGDHHG